MFYQYSPDLNDNLNIDFDNLLKKAMGLLGAKQKLVSIVQVEKKSQEVENLVKRYNHKTCISSTFDYVITLSSVPTYQLLYFLAVTPI